MLALIEILCAIIIAYLFGSISSAIIVCQIAGLPDPRTTGSGNPGATNVLRMGAKKAAIATLLGDVLKGTVPVLLAKWYGMQPIGLACVALSAFLGHLFPLFFGFRGGKGVATAFGCCIALSWQASIALIATWLTVVFLFRYSSLGAIITAIIAPVYLAYFGNFIYAFIGSLIGLILIYRHRNNVRNLWLRKEDKIGSKKFKEKKAANEGKLE